MLKIRFSLGVGATMMLVSTTCLILACAKVTAHSQEVPPRSIADTFRAERAPLELLENLYQPNASVSVFLARVTRVDKSDESVYGRYRRDYPGVDPTYLFSVKGGRLELVERLYGADSPPFVEVDNSNVMTGEAARKTRFKGHRLTWLQVGRTFIVGFDRSADPDHALVWAAWIRGPEDRTLAMFRRHTGWLKMPDRETALSQIGAMLTNRTEPSESRIAAYYALNAWVSAGQYGTSDGPYYPRKQSLLVQLLAQTDLPPALKARAVASATIDHLHEPAAGSDAVKLARQLIACVSGETDKEVLDAAAASLSRNARRSESDIETGITAYHFPDLIAAIEQREMLDRSGGGESRLSSILADLKKAIASDLNNPTIKVVVRHLP